MKKILLTTCLLFVMNVSADIEYSADQDSKPTIIEISKNRACFEEVAKEGCGDPGEDIKHFKTCLKNVSATLSGDCRKMMSELYGTK